MKALVALSLLALCGCISASEQQPYNPYMTSVASGATTFQGEFGEVRRLAADVFGMLGPAGAQVLTVKMLPCSAQQPHWHPNADETVFVLKGSGVRRTQFADGKKLQAELRAGDVESIPLGALHSVSNPGCETLELLVVYDNAGGVKETLVADLLAAPAEQTSAFLAAAGLQAYGNGSAQVQDGSQPQPSIFSLGDPQCTTRCAAAGSAAAAAPAPSTAGGGRRLLAQQAADGAAYNDFMGSLTAAPVTRDTPLGTQRELNAETLPGLEQTHESYATTVLRPCATIQPHFQPVPSEISYIAKGSVNATVVVNSTLYSHTLKEGDLVAIPPGQLHWFANTGCGDAQLLTLFELGPLGAAATRPAPLRVFPVQELAQLEPQELAASFGVSGPPPAVQEGGSQPPFAPMGVACTKRCE